MSRKNILWDSWIPLIFNIKRPSCGRMGSMNILWSGAEFEHLKMLNAGLIWRFKVQFLIMFRVEHGAEVASFLNLNHLIYFQPHSNRKTRGSKIKQLLINAHLPQSHSTWFSIDSMFLSSHPTIPSPQPGTSTGRSRKWRRSLTLLITSHS